MNEEQKARLLHVAHTCFYNALARIDFEVDELKIDPEQDISEIVLQAFTSAVAEVAKEDDEKKS